MADRYEVSGGNEKWSDTSNWSTSSGGSSGASVPGAADKAIFDGNSGNMDADTNVSVLELEFAAGYGNSFVMDGYELAIGSGGLTIDGGTIEFDASVLAISGPFSMSGGTLGEITASYTITGDVSITGGVWDMGLGSLVVTVQGNFVASAGTVDAPSSGTLEARKDFDVNGCTFGARTSLLQMANNGVAALLDTTGNTLYQLELLKGNQGFSSVPSTVVVTDDFTITSIGNTFIGTFDVRGNISSAESNNINWLGHVKVTGSAVQTITGTSIPGFEIDKSGGSLTFLTDFVFVGKTITFKYVAGTVDFNSKVLTFMGRAQTVDIGALVLPEIIVNTGAYTMVSVGTSIIGGDMTVTTCGMWTGDWELRGNVTVNDSVLVTGLTGKWFFKGSAEQSLGTGGGIGEIPPFEVDKSGGTLTLSQTIRITGASANNPCITHTAGGLDFGTSKLILRTSAKTLDIGTIKLYDLELNLTVWDVDAVGGTIYVGHDFIITTCDDIRCDIEVEGNISSADSDVTGTGSIKLVGTGAQTIDSGGVGLFGSGNFVIDKPSGSAILAAALTLGATGQDLVVAQGTLDLAGFDLTVDDIFDIDGTLKWKGSETLTVGTLQLDATQSTVIYYDTPDVVLNDLATAFFNLTLGAEKLHEIEAGTEVTVAGTLASDGIVSTKALLRSDTPGTLAKVTLSGSGASTMAAGVLATDIDSRDGNQVDALGSVANNCYNWHVSDDIRGVPLNSPVVRRPGPRSRQLVQGVMEWT